MADLGDVVKNHLHFLEALPHVKPFYTVKCNSSKGLVRLLAELGAGFDCASKVGARAGGGGGGKHPEGFVFLAACCEEGEDVNYCTCLSFVLE